MSICHIIPESEWNHKASGELPQQEGNEKTATPLPPFVSAYELCNAPDTEYPEPEVIIEGLLARGDLAQISAGSKSYKSWLAIQTGVCVANGIPLLGRNTTKAKVLILNCELKAVSLRRRIKTISNRLNVGLHDLFVWNLRNVSFGPGLLDVMRERIMQEGIGLVIIDPLYSLLSMVEGENVENSNPAMTKLLGIVREACEEAGAAALIVHHHAKGDSTLKSNLDRGAGAGALGRFPDLVMSLVPHQSSGAYVVEVDLRDFPPVDAFVVRWERNLMVMDDDMDPAMKKIAKPANQKGEPEDIKRFLTEKPITPAELEQRFAQAFNCCQKTAERKVKQARSLGFCQVNRHGVFISKQEVQDRF